MLEMKLIIFLRGTLEGHAVHSLYKEQTYIIHYTLEFLL